MGQYFTIQDNIHIYRETRGFGNNGYIFRYINPSSKLELAWIMQLAGLMQFIKRFQFYLCQDLLSTFKDP